MTARFDETGACKIGYFTAGALHLICQCVVMIHFQTLRGMFFLLTEVDLKNAQLSDIGSSSNLRPCKRQNTSERGWLKCFVLMIRPLPISSVRCSRSLLDMNKNIFKKQTQGCKPNAFHSVITITHRMPPIGKKRTRPFVVPQ